MRMNDHNNTVITGTEVRLIAAIVAAYHHSPRRQPQLDGLWQDLDEDKEYLLCHMLEELANYWDVGFSDIVEIVEMFGVY